MTLYELNCLVRDAIADQLPDTYWVQGELSEGREGAGGHFYGEMVQREERRGETLARARVNCWANVYRRLSREFQAMTGESLRAGLTVMVEVSVTFHPQYGYSLNIVDIDPSYTLGDMARRRKQILAQLEADGILHANAELALPLVPRRIAVVSSAHAAGYGDFCNQLQHNERGYHFSLRLFPALMQGARVEESVIEALQQIADEADQWDVVVIIRGGGATSDLSDFDSYPLAACVAQMPLPVITGIGHERDETVLDHVAHTHLKTPTAVATFLIDRMTEAEALLDQLAQQLTRATQERLALHKQRLQHLATLLPLGFRNMGERQSARLQLLSQRLVASARSRQEQERHRLALMEQRLQGLDPQLLLARGYSMTLTADGRLLRDASQVGPGQEIVTRLAKGQIKSVVK